MVQHKKNGQMSLWLRRKEITYLFPDDPKEMPYPGRENRVVTNHNWDPFEAGYPETVIMTKIRHENDT